MSTVIRYGEFPFRLEYEINGRRELIEDTLIIKYKGIGIDEGRGKFRKWEDRLASGNKNITRSGLINEDELMEQYGIKLISWDIADSIVNSFK